MALIKRMKEGDKSPTLYSLYGKQYDFNQFQRDADEGVHEYIASLKRGNKDADQFMKAYSDIMSGILDGSITFKDGRYIDSKGRYSNGLSNKPNKDYYGLMANYIYNKQRNQNEYVLPEDKTKIKWSGNSSIGLAITRNMFNSDTWNNKDFQDLNEWDEFGKVKGQDNRHKRLYDSFNYILGNFDNLFSRYSEQDKKDSLAYITDAMNRLKDNKIDAGDYLALSKAAGGLDYRSMFADKAVEVPTQNGSVPVSNTDFLSWVSKKYPVFRGTLATPRNLNDGRVHDQNTLNNLVNTINKLSDDQLYRIVMSDIADSDGKYNFNNFDFILNTFKDEDHNFSNHLGTKIALHVLKSRNLLKPFGQDKPNMYYIPNSDSNSRSTSWVWYAYNNTSSEMSYHDIPYWRDRIRTEWQGQKSGLSDDSSYLIDRYGYLKEGGILMASGGTQLQPWYSTITDFDPSKYKYQYDTSKLINADLSDDAIDPWVSNIVGIGSGRYLPSEGNTREYTQGIEDSQYYKNFGKALFNPDGTFTDVGLAWAKASDALLPSNSAAAFFDQDGNLRTSWTVNNNDIYNRRPQTFTNLSDYANYVRNDQILGSRHNVFLNTGNRYFYKDQAGNKHWVNPDDIDKYIISDTPVSSWNDDKTVFWNDYEITGLKNPENANQSVVAQNDDEKSSSINLTQEHKDKQPSTSFGDFMQQISPDLMDAGRLLRSIRTNNKVAETVRKSLTPVLKDTYELYSPITGAFSEMQLRNSQAASIRRAAARPFTSDASLQLAGSLDANRQATDLERQGFLSDDAEIKQTKAEALKRQWDNQARRNDVANFNRASINQTNRELAQLEGTRLKQNWQSVDNFLQGLESRARKRYETDKERRDSFRLQTQQQDIDNQYQDMLQKAQDAAQKWQKDPANSSRTLSEMPGYFQFLRDLARWRNTKILGAHADIYRYKYNNDYLNKSAYDIGSQYGFYKGGGSLRPSVLHMINRVLKNENNT